MRKVSRFYLTITCLVILTLLASFSLTLPNQHTNTPRTQVASDIEYYSTITKIYSNGDEETYTVKASLNMSGSPECSTITTQVKKAERALNALQKKYTQLKKKKTPKKRNLNIAKRNLNKQKKRVTLLKTTQEQVCNDTNTTPDPSTPNPAPTTGGEYSFLSTDESGVPARWDKCKTIRYKINPNGATESGISEINLAINKVAEASGLTFQYVGSSNIVPFAYEEWYQSLIQGRQDAELYIGFSTASSVPDLAGDAVGLGGSLWAQGGNKYSRDPEIIIGGLVIDNEAEIEPGFGPGRKRGSIIMHELGHVLNLGHVSDAQELMYPEMLDTTTGEFGLGDRAGLRKLLEYPCF